MPYYEAVFERTIRASETRGLARKFVFGPSGPPPWARN
jgi:hypothetical protein